MSDEVRAILFCLHNERGPHDVTERAGGLSVSWRCLGGREVRLRPVSRKQVREKRVKGTVYEVVPDE